MSIRERMLMSINMCPLVRGGQQTLPNPGHVFSKMEVMYPYAEHSRGAHGEQILGLGASFQL